MSVHKDKQAEKSGRTAWQVNYHRTTYRGFKTKKEAEQYEAKLKLGLVGGGETISTDPLFYNLADDFLVHFKEERKYSTYNKCEAAIRNHIKPNFKNKKLSKITAQDCIKFRSIILKTDLTTVTKNYVLEKFKAIFTFARKYYEYKDNPVEFLERFKKTEEDVLKVKKKEVSYISPEDFSKFIDAVKKQKRSIDISDYVLLFQLLYWTGLRRGEAMAITYEDVTDDKYLIVNKSLTTKTEQTAFEITTPKTLSSFRKVKLDDELYEMIMEHKKHHQKNIAFEESWFISGGATPVTTSSTERIKKKAIKDSGIIDFKIHDLRGSHITYLLENGVSAKAVASRVGHTDVKMTLNVYAKTTEQSTDEILDAINKSKSTNHTQ